MRRYNNQYKYRYIFTVYIAVKIDPNKTTTKIKIELISKKVSWIIISFDRDKTNIILVNI